eukprot:Hpha_TRINITY_DN16083_c0_g1::TRINITY_DN16083_c0_g1_i2::g.117762::m.117762/K13750/SLC24A2, NCKX2; solute carrier family 24 (sodium/potassium/calcium exchanger), member 2
MRVHLVRRRKSRVVWLALLAACFALGIFFCGERGVVGSGRALATRRLLQASAGDGNETAPQDEPDTTTPPSTAEAESLYLPDLFTGKRGETAPGTVIFYLMGMFYMFFALAIVCDDYFVPALEGLSESLQLSDDVAGATFMAAGGSAPELFTSILGVFVAKSNVGFGTIVGSAVFNVLFVIGACSIATMGMVKGGLPLTWYPLFRDSIFYGIDLACLTVFFRDQKIEWWEALILLCLYGCYVGFMAVNEKVMDALGVVPAGKPDPKGSAAKESEKSKPPERKTKPAKFDSSLELNLSPAVCSNPLKEKQHTKDSTETDKTDCTVPQSLRRVSSVKRMQREIMAGRRRESGSDSDEESGTGSRQNTERSGKHSNGDEDEDERWTPQWPEDDGILGQVKFVILFPLNFPLWLTLPDCSQDEKRLVPRYFLGGFFGSILWIAVFSYFMVWWAEVAGHTVNIPSEVMGFTLLAAGTSVPDLITSVVVARNGCGDMAVSSSIGSNIFDITFGLPLPWLLYSLFNGGATIDVTSDSLGTSVLLLFGMLIATILSIAGFGWRLNQGLGVICFLLYVVFVTVTLLIEFGKIDGINL